MYVTLLTLNLKDQVTTACGSSSTIKLDGRRSFQNWKNDAQEFLEKENKFKNIYIGYALFSNIRDFLPIFSTHKLQ